VSASLDPLGVPQGAARPPWSVFRAELEGVGFRPSKGLGQNFLVDGNAARSIARDAGLAPGEHVLEIGAGCGFLTLHLAELGHEVLAVEIDARLLTVARRVLAGRQNVRWLQVDVLSGKHALAPELLAELPPGAWHLVSNLPYSISAPLLVLLTRLANPPRSMTVLVQEEVARRLTARPGDREWGPLGARLGLFYGARAGRALGPQLFWPRPRVASRVVGLLREPLEPLGEEDLACYDALVDRLFQQRRKQLLAGLSSGVGGREIALGMLLGAGLDPRARPEALSPSQLLTLARCRDWTDRSSPRR
jgi:16S rRNA (adenine1518-N6/adenine1519-N6)-dimethyltransferase